VPPVSRIQPTRFRTIFVKMPSVSWKLRLSCCVLAIVGGASFVGASEISSRRNLGMLASIRRASIADREPVHAEPGAEILQQVAVIGQRDVTGSRFPSGLTIPGGTHRRMILFTFDDGPSTS
jgi:hypothetical protein